MSAYQAENFVKIASKKHGKPADTAVINEIIAVGKQRTSDSENAVSLISRSLNESIIHPNMRLIKVELEREVKNFTVNRGLAPNLDSTPHMIVNLSFSPHDSIEYKANGSTGTIYDLNVHIHSKNNHYLPIGIYEFEYIVEVENQDIEAGLDVSPQVQLSSHLHFDEFK